MQKKDNIYYIGKIFEKHFSKYKSLKKDLIQEGYRAFLECQKNYDKTKASLYAYAEKPVFCAMLKYIKKCKFIETVSLEEKIGKGEELTYSETLVDTDNTIDLIDLKLSIELVVRNFSQQKQKVINEFLKFNCGQKAIAKKLKLSDEYVNRIIADFRNELTLAIN